MKDLNYWEQFLNTGKIEDYLSYRKEISAVEAGTDRNEDKGAEPDAGTGQCYRDNIKSGTYRGI